ncbi:MAG: hypothetical protein IJO71_09315 [Microbacterium sp.]|uniref:Acb2/Tad1 domain-containing protein n=1 Tax=Microbacterium sp. TaxID=51671 RepID=UPI0025FDAED8|nr:hypothetical protein [Microbacterium sp.]MBQ9917379.1 hypothetical protein [Microbacterium sp.]
MAGELERFTAAATSSPPTQHQRDHVAHNQEAVRATARAFDQLPEGRLRSLAYTALEEALMWANKAVFQ